jgi:hypothetical protein
MSIDWRFLRTINGSQQSAFEELCCQLARHEETPKATQFKRIGAPDAGLECYWVTEDGTEVGWQAKFFLSPPNDSQWRQIDKSIETALDKHPQLSSYVVCLPIDRQDPRIEGQSWFMDKWETHVEKWNRLADQKGMFVSFHYWGGSEIFDRLSLNQHRGRYFFWFNQNLFDYGWFEQRVRQNIANVGERYSPKLNFSLPIAKTFDGLGQRDSFLKRLERHYYEVDNSFERASPATAREFLPEAYSKLNQKLDQLKSALVYERASVPLALDFERITAISSDCVGVAEEIHSLLSAESDERRRLKMEAREASGNAAGENYIEDEFSGPKYHLRELNHRMYLLEEFVNSPQSRTVNEPFLLVTGNAGNGKTHLFCDIAEQRLAENLPTIFLLGQHFASGEPFSQIITQLGLSCTRDELLGALEASAEATGEKALILIDAINESDDRSIWVNHLAGFRHLISQYKWLSVAVSVRTSYRDVVIPAGLENYVELEHEGFGEKVFEATDFFFREYGIKAPTVPILTPEFHNPLFLKTFCTALKNSGLTEVPKGLEGITSVFEFYLQSLNKKISTSLGFDELDNLVRRAVHDLADGMIAIEDVYLRRDAAKQIVGLIHSSERYENSLFAHLISEGLLSADFRYNFNPNEPDIDIIRFTYEKFTDSMIAARLLEQHLDVANPKKSFRVEAKIGGYFKDEWSSYSYKGILEALSIQLPEKLGKELFEVAPRLKKWRITREVFIQSLVWRKPNAIFKSTKKYANEEILTDYGSTFDFWDAIISVSSNPSHTWNAEFLHNHLNRFSLAERDSWWSVFLHKHYSNVEYSAIDRLIDWSWSDSDKSHIDEDSVYLSGITLTWFLTTSNRFLRDRATKALVNLFTHRLKTFGRLLRLFHDVNDLYVLERLYAVAYGCVMRNDRDDDILEIAQLVFDDIFKSGEPIPHLLLRDYARGVIELALHRGMKVKGSLAKVRPPYRSKFPENIPSEDELRANYQSGGSGTDDGDVAAGQLYSSVMNNLGDFSNYIIRSEFSYWRSRRLGEPLPESIVFRSFERSLSKKQKIQYDRYLRVRENIKFYNSVTRSERLKTFKALFSKMEIKSAINHFEQKVRVALGKKKSKVFDETVIPYLDKGIQQHEDSRFDIGLAKNWILQRVYDLGWDKNLFGKFDRWNNQNSSDYRSAHKVERIGKKYQWIALSEFMAYVADNFQFGGEGWYHEDAEYYGPWQLSRRDIDPSYILRTTESVYWWETAHSWWFPVKYDYENAEQDSAKWLRVTDDLPKLTELLQVANPKNNTSWFNLDCHFEWRDGKANIEGKDLSRKTRLWYSIHSFFVKKSDFEEVINWAKEQTFFGKFMPESHGNSQLFLGEYFWSPAYRYFNVPYYHRSGWTKFWDEPKKIIANKEQYSRDPSGLDCSIYGVQAISILLPSQFLADRMKLTWNGIEGCYFDPERRLIAFDPSVRERGPSALLFDETKLATFLDENQLELFWIVRGEKFSYDEKVYKHVGPLSISAVFFFKDGKITGDLRTIPED